jgi:hypothetical protein
MSKRVARSESSASFLKNNQRGEIMEHCINPLTPKPNGLKKTKKVGLAGLTALTLASTIGVANLAGAQTVSDTLPAGLGCSFPLTYTLVGQQPVSKQWKDENGKVVRLLQAGKGTTNTLTNANTGASITLKPSGGSVSRGTLSTDGTFYTYVATGFNTLIWFPSDVPAGPATTLYIGRVVYTVDIATGTYTLVGTSGKQTDICALLSPTP